MPSFVINTTSTTAQVLTGFNTGLIGRDGILSVFSGAAITATNTAAEVAQLNVQGIIHATGNSSTGRILDFDGAEISVLIGQTGSLSGTGVSSRGLDLSFHDRAAITNHGELHADGNAIRVDQRDISSLFDLLNTGTITSQGIGILFADALSAIDIFNSGQIIADTVAIDFDNSGNSASLDLFNSGKIIAGNHAINLSRMESFAYIYNTGEITANVAIENSTSVNFGNVTFLRNDGLIHGLSQAYQGSVGTDNIHNSGTINGIIVLEAGNDTYNGKNGTVNGRVLGGEGMDRVYGGASGDELHGDADTDTLFGHGGDDLIYGGTGNDSIRGQAGDDVIYAGADFSGTADDDMLFGGAGDDELYGGSGNDTIKGGAGDDTIGSVEGANEMMGGTGRDDITGGAGTDLIYAGADNDRLSGAGNKDTLFGGNGDDVLFGGAQVDQLIGGRGEDSLSGGGGTDTIDGGFGDDVLTGGTLTDTFVMRAGGGSDRITDFEDGVDRIDLRPFGYRPIDFATVIEPNLSEAGGSTTLLDLSAIGGNGVLQIEGLSFSDADASDFLL